MFGFTTVTRCPGHSSLHSPHVCMSYAWRLPGRNYTTATGSAAYCVHITPV